MTSQPRQRIRWGLIGASDIAATRLVPAIRSTGSPIHGVMSSSASHAESFAHLHEIGAHTTDVQTLLGLDVDAVYISSTNEKHYQQTKLALLAGKHVLCEKPMALSEDEAREMVQLAAGRRLILAVNHHLPHNAVHRKVREIVSSGTIGTVLAAQVSNAGLLHERLRGWRLSEPRMGPGVILDLTSHDASVLNPLLGMPLSVTCLAAAQADWNPGEGTDTAVTLIEYKTEKGNRVFAQTIDSFALPHAETSLRLFGTNGSLQVRNAMTQESSGTITLTNAEGQKVFKVESKEDPYVVILEMFEQAVHGQGRPAVSGEDGLLSLRVALAAQESSATGATVSLD